jgi:hypothetical protein
VNDPGDAGVVYRTKIGDVVVMRKVDNKRVDSYGWRLTAAFHAMRVQQTVGPYWFNQSLATEICNIRMGSKWDCR